MSYLARGPCPKGEHLTERTPVVCVPNKGAKEPPGEPFPPFPYEVSAVLGFAVLLLFIVLAARQVGRWRAKRHGITQTVVDLSDALPLGNLVQSPTLGPGDLGWIAGRQALLPRHRLNLHALVAGATGSGKSTTVDRIEYEAVRAYRPQVIHFDCKGRRNGAARFLALMLRAYEEHEIRVAPIEPYDGWRGDTQAHLNRLLAIQDFSDSQPYYTAATKDLLQQALAEDGRLPRFAGELIDRVALTRDGIDPKVASGTLARYRGFFNSLGGLLDGSWAFDDVGACYVELPGMARREDAIAFGRYLLEDFMHYIAERKDPEREVLLVLDDFSAISTGDEAVNLVERAREFGVGVVLTTQSYSGLGPGADRIVDACNGALVIHRMSDPAPFTRRAGTVWRKMTSVSQPAHQPGLISGILFNQQPETPRHTTRDQEFPRIEPNEARSLPPGDAFVIAEGRAQRMHVNPVADLDVKGEFAGISSASLVDLASGILNQRKELAADIHNLQPAGGPPPSASNPDLDF